MAQLFMTPPEQIEYSHLLDPQAELLRRARDILGPLVGTSFFIDEDRGWAIRLTVLKAITAEERLALDELVASFDSPIVIEEKRRPPSLATVNLKTSTPTGPDR